MRFLTILIIILIMIFASNQNFLPDGKVGEEVSMAASLEPKQVDLEEHLTSQAVRQEALIRLLVKKRIFSRGEFSEMVRVVSQEMKPIAVRLPTPVEGR